MMFVAGRHIRAGRKLIGWDVRQLAEAAGISPQRIVSLEDDRVEPMPTVDAVAWALSGQGVRFLLLREHGVAGVWLARPINLGLPRRRPGCVCRQSSRAVRRGLEQRALIGAACGLLRWSRRRLASRSGVSGKALRLAWQADGPLPVWLADPVFSALRRAGVRFNPAQAGGRLGAVLVDEAAFAGVDMLIFDRSEPRGWE